MLIIRGVNLFPSHIEELLLGSTGAAPHYLLEVWRDGPLDQVRVRVEQAAGAAASAAAAANKDDLAATLTHAIKTFAGVSVEVVVEPPGTLPRSTGKAQRVVDHRQENERNG